MPLTIVAGMQKIGHLLLDLLYPPRCVGCGQAGMLYCAACLDAVPRLMPPFCSLCGRPQEMPGLCSACSQRPTTIDGIRSAAAFSGSLRKAIHHLKYRYMGALAEPLADLLVAFWQKNPLPGDVLVPVPLHRRRRRERGYNQSQLLAQCLGRTVGVPVVCNVLRRHRYTAAQTHLGAEERRRNVVGAFSCVDARLEGGGVVLVDDVCTTSSTLEACSVALKAAGVRSVWGLTLARAV